MDNYIEDFENKNLPEIILSKNEIDEIKYKVMKESIGTSLKKLVEYNKKVSIDFSIDEAFNIYIKEKQRGDIMAGGLKHYYLMKDVLFKSIDKDAEAKGIIVKKVVVWNKKQAIIPSPQWVGNRLYSILYLLEDRVLTYYISASLEVIEIGNYTLEKVRYAGKIKEGKKELWSIGLDYKEFNWYIKDDEVSKELEQFIEKLNNMGIPKEMRRIGQKIGGVFIVIIGVIVLLAFIIQYIMSLEFI